MGHTGRGTRNEWPIAGRFGTDEPGDCVNSEAFARSPTPTPTFHERIRTLDTWWHLASFLGALVANFFAGGPSAAALPPPAPAVAVPVTVEEARALAESLFGCSVTRIEEDPRTFRLRVEDCGRTLPCPLDRVRDTRCGHFRWEPDDIRLYRTSFVAPVSGHLARNRVVAVDLRSSSAGLAHGTLHGVLVFPSASPDPRSRPAFTWYLTRLGRTLALDLRDVNADGSRDLLYTYSSALVGGVQLVSRDVWTMTDLVPDRLISSGDALPGMALGAFDGVPLHRDDEEGFDRGAWHVETLEPSRPLLVLIERASFPAVAGPDWEFQVVTDLGEGWMEVLSGAPESGRDNGVFVDGALAGTCAPADVPAGLSLGARTRLLRLETACRDVREASGAPSGLRWADAVRWLLAARRAFASGLRVVALGLEAAAAAALVGAGPASPGSAWPARPSQGGSRPRAVGLSLVEWAVAVVLTTHVAWVTHREWTRAYDPRFSDPPRWSDVRAFPAFRPVFEPVDRAVRFARRLIARESRAMIQ